MAYGAGMSGLLGALSGAGDIAKDERQTAEKEASAKKMMEMEIEMKDAYAQRVAERTKNQNISDLKTINDSAETRLANKAMAGMGAAGEGAELTPENLQAIKDNPDALAAYRAAGAKGLLNASRQEEAEAKTDAALSIGRTDYADKFESTAKGERADAKEQSRHEEQMVLLKRQLATADRAASRVEKSDEKADVRNRVNSWSTVLKENGDQMLKLETLKSTSMDEKMAAELDGKIKVLRKESDQIAASLKRYGDTGSLDAPKIEQKTDRPPMAELFGTGEAPAKPAVAKPSAEPEAKAKPAPRGLLETPQKKQPSQGDIEMLKNRPTPDKVEQFDAIYGEGAAKKILDQERAKVHSSSMINKYIK